MPIFVIVLQKQDKSADTETLDAGLQGGIVAQIIISVFMIGFYIKNMHRENTNLNYLIHFLEVAAFLFVFAVGGKPEMIVKEGSLREKQVIYMKWGLIFLVTFAFRGIWHILLQQKHQGMQQRMLFSCIFQAQQNNEGLKTQTQSKQAAIKFGEDK